MATRERQSGKSKLSIPSVDKLRFGLVVSEWNDEITEALYEGARKCLLNHGVKPECIIRKDVPGSFELSLGAQYMVLSEKVDAVICLGCVIQGETPHFTYICQSVTQGITALNLKYNLPFIFGVLTTNTLEQARERAGGTLGNKGEEAALTALGMVALAHESKIRNKDPLGFGK